MRVMRHILSILLQNESGALTRVSGLFSARGYNIESLNVAPTNDPALSRATVVTSGSNEIIAQITTQLNKLVDVVRLDEFTERPHLEREIMLVRVQATGEAREEIKRLTDIFRGRILDVTETSYTIEMTGAGDKLDGFLSALGPKAIREVVRSGALGIARGDQTPNNPSGPKAALQSSLEP